jgi:hypothetical protein
MAPIHKPEVRAYKGAVKLASRGLNAVITPSINEVNNKGYIINIIASAKFQPIKAAIIDRKAIPVVFTITPSISTPRGGLTADVIEVPLSLL